MEHRRRSPWCLRGFNSRRASTQGITLAVAGLLIGLVASIGADRALAAMFAGGPGGDNRTDLAAYVLVSVYGTGRHPAGRLCPRKARGT